MAMHSVYMRFERVLGLWRVSFTSPSAPQGLRTFTFSDAGKIEQLAQRGGALTCLGRQAGS